MGEIMAIPFRLTPGGSVVKVSETSDAGVAQLISAAVMTRLGERPMFPTFGVSDPVYSSLSTPQTAAVLAAYGPNTVRINEIKSEFVDSTTQKVTISYSDREINA